MNDTRLLYIKDDLATALWLLREIYDELIPGAYRGESDMFAHIAAAAAATRSALDAVTTAGVPICRATSSVGSVCYRQPEHDGPHYTADRHTSWTDDQDTATGAAIAASMQGRK